MSKHNGSVAPILFHTSPSGFHSFYPHERFYLGKSYSSFWQVHTRTLLKILGSGTFSPRIVYTYPLHCLMFGDIKVLCKGGGGCGEERYAKMGVGFSGAAE